MVLRELVTSDAETLLRQVRRDVRWSEALPAGLAPGSAVPRPATREHDDSTSWSVPEHADDRENGRQAEHGAQGDPDRRARRRRAVGPGEEQIHVQPHQDGDIGNQRESGEDEVRGTAAVPVPTKHR